jgi:transposase
VPTPELVEPVLSAWRFERCGRALDFERPPGHDLREILDAILYVSRIGVQCRYLPHDFPPWESVYGYFAKWQKDGVFAQLNGLLRELVRQKEGKRAQPSACVIDAQSVKTSPSVHAADQGIEAGKPGRHHRLHPGRLPPLRGPGASAKPRLECIGVVLGQVCQGLAGPPPVVLGKLIETQVLDSAAPDGAPFLRQGGAMARAEVGETDRSAGGAAHGPKPTGSSTPPCWRAAATPSCWSPSTGCEPRASWPAAGRRTTTPAGTPSASTAGWSRRRWLAPPTPRSG